jgi:2'-5' RNA ligase
MRRLFFALWPSDTERDALHAAAQKIHPASGGRLTSRSRLHQTLVFLGVVTDENLSKLNTFAAAVRVAPFELEFGTIGYWRHNRIVWAAPASTPAALTALVEALEQGLQRAGIAYDRRSYAPHVTLLRNARAPTTLPALKLTWPVTDFVLVESMRGAQYRVIARWPLTV